MIGINNAPLYIEMVLNYFILEEESSKCPNSSKDKVEFVDILSCVWWCVLWGQQGLQKVAQSLDHTHLVQRIFS